MFLEIEPEIVEQQLAGQGQFCIVCVKKQNASVTKWRLFSDFCGSMRLISKMSRLSSTLGEIRTTLLF